LSKSPHINIAQPGLADAIRSPRTMGIWEVLRRYRRAASASRLAELCQCSLAEAQQSLDLLERATLVRKRRASRGRRSAVYETAVSSISVIFDRGDPGEARIFRSLEQFVTRELEGKHFQHEIPITSAPAGHWSYYHCNPMFLEAADIEELRRRIARVEEFVSLLNDRQSESMTVQSCNHVMAIRVSPLGGSVMPQPHVKLVSRNIAEAPRRAVSAPSTRLSRREREAVLALRDGETRAAVAKHLGISVYTLGTLCKRAYRKLGINRVSQLRDIAID
jgi:DNA-binding CsgD family transcriptional regulator